MSKRAAIYVRVSSKQQVEGYSLDAQTRETREYCERQGWTIVAEYRDEGKSARSKDIRKRPGFQRMLQDAETRQFEVVVFHKLDRFGRNLVVLFNTIERLGELGIEVRELSSLIDMKASGELSPLPFAQESRKSTAITSAARPPRARLNASGRATTTVCSRSASPRMSAESRCQTRQHSLASC